MTRHIGQVRCKLWSWFNTVVLISVLIAVLMSLGCRALAPGDKRNNSAGDAVQAPDASACGLGSPRQWQSFLEEHAEDPRWLDTCEDSTCDAAHFTTVKSTVQRVLEKCQAQIAASAKISACTQNMRRFVPAWLRQHDSVSFGFALDNRSYFAAQEAADRPPGMMVPPAEIIAAIPSRAKIEEAARQKGWRYLTHDSAIDGVRTFIYKPEPGPLHRYDQWILVNYPDGGDKVATDQPVSVLTIQLRDISGNPLPRTRINFRDHTLKDLGGGNYAAEPAIDGNGKCFACHPSGARKLIERPGKVLAAKPVKGVDADYEETGTKVPGEFAATRLKEFNQILMSYGIPDWDGKIEPADFGPALGREQNCTSCHDGQVRGMLTVATSFAQTGVKIVDQLAMPPERDQKTVLDLLEKSDLNAMSASDNEKFNDLDTAHKKVMAEYVDARGATLKNWLLETPCE